MYTHILFYLLGKQCSTLVFANDRTFDDVSLAVFQDFSNKCSNSRTDSKFQDKIFFQDFQDGWEACNLIRAFTRLLDMWWAVASIWFENCGVLGSRPSPLLRKRPETTPSTTPNSPPRPPTSKSGGSRPQPPGLTPMVMGLRQATDYEWSRPPVRSSKHV
jgi:hypothetical protein